MSTAWAVFYGILQGLTEFLPISSSGHLALVPFFFELKDPGVIFDLMMHLGTALAILIYFYKDVLVLIKQLVLFLKIRKFSEEVSYAVNFIFATFVTVIFILMIKDFALEYGRNPKFIAINLIVFGIILFIADRLGNESKDLTVQTDFKRAFVIGFSQMLAIFPGVSRSGITITSARFSGLSRVNAGRFSFLLSLPIIFASILYKLKSVLKNEETMNFDLIHIFVGVGISFIVGIITIHFFLKLLNKLGFGIYTIYRILLGCIILYLV